MADEQTLTITQVRSAIGAIPAHRGTLRALGLRRVGATTVLPDRPEIRGMLARVTHLVEVSASADASRAPRRRAARKADT